LTASAATFAIEQAIKVPAITDKTGKKCLGQTLTLTLLLAQRLQGHH
jgi:hypothetical protein